MSAAVVGQRSDSPIAALAQRDPVAVAVARELTLYQQWDSAIAWAGQWSDRQIQGDVLADIARQAVRQQAPDTVTASLQEAATGSELVQARVLAALALLSEERWQAAEAALPPAPDAIVDQMPSVGTMLTYRKPDLTESWQTASAVAEMARSAATGQQPEIAAGLIVRLADGLAQVVPPTSVVREACGELDWSAEKVHTRIRSHLGRSGSADVTSEFRTYRRGLDRLAAVAEERRLFLIRLLCGIVEQDAGAGLTLALEQSEYLQDELTVDPLCLLIAGEATLAGGSVTPLEAANTVRVPRGRRTPRQLEDTVAPLWHLTLSSLVVGHDNTIFMPMERTSDLPGLRACLLYRITEGLAIRSDLSVLDAAAALKDEVARETSLWGGALWLVRAGGPDEVEEWSVANRLSATDRVLTMSGIINGLSRPESTEEDSAP